MVNITDVAVATTRTKRTARAITRTIVQLLHPPPPCRKSSSSNNGGHESRPRCHGDTGPQVAAPRKRKKLPALGRRTGERNSPLQRSGANESQRRRRRSEGRAAVEGGEGRGTPRKRKNRLPRRKTPSLTIPPQSLPKRSQALIRILMRAAARKRGGLRKAITLFEETSRARQLSAASTRSGRDGIVRRKARTAQKRKWLSLARETRREGQRSQGPVERGRSTLPVRKKNSPIRREQLRNFAREEKKKGRTTRRMERSLVTRASRGRSPACWLQRSWPPLGLQAAETSSEEPAPGVTTSSPALCPLSALWQPGSRMATGSPLPSPRPLLARYTGCSLLQAQGLDRDQGPSLAVHVGGGLFGSHPGDLQGAPGVATVGGQGPAVAPRGHALGVDGCAPDLPPTRLIATGPTAAGSAGLGGPVSGATHRDRKSVV